MPIADALRGSNGTCCINMRLYPKRRSFTMCGVNVRVSANEKFKFMRLSFSPYPGTFADENGRVCGNNAQNALKERCSPFGNTWSKSSTTWFSENFAGIENVENPVPARWVCGVGMA